VESVHRGIVAVVNAAGGVVASLGDVESVTYMRSSAKPLQAARVAETGAFERFGFTEAEVAVVCGSHGGEERHVRAVSSILDRIGLDERALTCGVHPPLHRPSAEALAASGRSPSPVHSNCSGKHAGMLAACVHLGLPTEGYAEMDHPLQRMIAEYVASMAGLSPGDLCYGVDGCGVPTFGMPLCAMARAFAAFGVEALDASGPTSRGGAGLVARSMIARPEMVGGWGRLDTEIMSATGGRMLAKSGAEGVFCVAILDKGWGLALKVEDGGARATGPAVLESLRQLGALAPPEMKKLEGYRVRPNHNVAGDVVGVIEPAFKLSPGRTPAGAETGSEGGADEGLHLG